MFILPVDIMERIKGRLGLLYGEDKASRLLERLALLASRYELCGLGCDDHRPCWDQTDAMLITYGDIVKSGHEPPLHTLYRFLENHLSNVASDIRILPFFPSSSEDGFAVIDYRQVDPDLGTWDDIHVLAQEFRLAFDLVISHASIQSEWFHRFQSGVAPERGYFIVMDHETDMSAVTRARTTPLLTGVETPCGKWWVRTTFGPDRADLNFANQDVLFEFLDIMLFHVKNGARIIQLDTIACLWKDPQGRCLDLPQNHEIVRLMRDVLDMLARNVLLLADTDLPAPQNLGYVGQGQEAHMVYQFSLPALLLKAFYTGSAAHLSRWAAEIPPPPAGCTYVNVTATQDGIRLRPLEGVIPREEIDELVEDVKRRGGLVSYGTDDTGEEIPVELNISYFDALAKPGHPDTVGQIARFLCSQTIMLSLRGIPAIYFHSLTATHNDRGAVEHTGDPRAINRSRWNEKRLHAQLAEPTTTTHQVFHEYVRRIKLRAEHRAFHPDGGQRTLDLGEALFCLERTAPDGSERILVLANVSPEPQRVFGEQIRDEGDEGGWHELIKGYETEVREGWSLDLVPYGIVWLVKPPAGGG